MASIDHLVDPSGMASGRYRILDSIEKKMDHVQVEILKKRVSRSLKDFPELTPYTVTVAMADPDDGRYYAKADWLNNLIFVPADHPIDYITLYHELCHLAIYRMDLMGWDVPKTSEPFCSILAVARMPTHLLTNHCKNPNIPYLGTPPIPREEWPEACRKALEYREEHRDYIQECKRLLKLIGPDTPPMTERTQISEQSADTGGQGT